MQFGQITSGYAQILFSLLFGFLFLWPCCYHGTCSTSWLPCVLQNIHQLKVWFSPVLIGAPIFYGSAKILVNPGSKDYIQFYLLKSEQQIRETEQCRNGKSRYVVLQHSFTEWNSLHHSLSYSNTKLETQRILRYSLKDILQKCMYQYCVNLGFECCLPFYRQIVFKQKQINK